MLVFTCLKHILDKFFYKTSEKVGDRGCTVKCNSTLKTFYFIMYTFTWNAFLKLCSINMALSEKIIRDFLFKFLIISLKDYSNKELFIMVT